MNNSKKISYFLFVVVVLSLTFFLSQSASAQVVPPIVFMRTTVVEPLDICFATHDDGSTLYSSADAQALQDAIAAATATDTIKIAGDCQDALPLTLTIPLTLSGGYTTSNWLTPAATAYPTIVDGNGSSRILSITGAIAVTLQNLTLQNGNADTGNGGCLYIDRSTVTLNDVVITGCRAEHGGGVRVGSTLILNAGTVISGNTAAGNGGGILVNGAPTATVIIQGGEILSNTAVNGGGVAVLGSGNVLTMTSGTISNNVAQGVDSADDFGGDGLGGGIYNTGAVWLTGGLLQNNRAQGGNGGDMGIDGGGNGGNGRGGAIYNEAVATLTIANLTLAANRAMGGEGHGDGSGIFGGWGGEGWGGAIENDGVLQLRDTTLHNNLAVGGAGGRGSVEGGYGGIGVGGALALLGSDPITLTNVQILTNTVQGGAGEDGVALGGDGGSGSGAGLYSDQHLTVTNSHFHGNRAVGGAGGGADGGSDGAIGVSEGGAIYATQTVVITATEFFANSADSGGAIFQDNSDFAIDQRIVNSIFAHNTAWLAPAGAAIHHASTGVIELIHNTIGVVGAGAPAGVAAIWLDQADQVAITNTIIVSHEIGIENNAGALTVTGAGNLFDSNSTADMVGNFAAGFALPNGDPAFVDAVSDDYRLTSSSAAVEQGVATGILRDFDQAVRPQGNAPDVGAFESPYIMRCFATADSGATIYQSVDSAAVRNAIADAVTLPSSEVRVAGTCEGVLVSGGTTQLALITQPLTLRGGYTTTDWLTSDFAANPTTLDALRSGRVIYATQPLTVANLTMQNGLVVGEDGGALYADQPLTLVNVQVLSSTAEYGGGVYLTGPTVINATHFEGNQASSDGGAIYAFDPVTLTQSVLLNNRGDEGGGAYLTENMVISATRFISNTAANRGGALFHNSAGGDFNAVYGRIVNSLFVGNQGGSVDGADLLLAAPRGVEILHSTFVDTTASPGGAGRPAAPQRLVAGARGGATKDDWHPTDERIVRTRLLFWLAPALQRWRRQPGPGDATPHLDRRLY